MLGTTLIAKSWTPVEIFENKIKHKNKLLPPWKK